ncbi:ARM repeat-containing protein [Glarea lozoyensis ATCC 20868]|uniref:ARM repeat-containing protein n=1 Tax=Glarea lozoyensis (strain ATCC 20868 / MF5171) TaxID=1116229 RepID=S3DBC1_GLAL2|nr:ARM repeat-containing protein [Glarea lozoyensis ATCC 20868]EPE29251.1 ARM repeat-containing protein [Glarea lozoyensis ATCC 20868]
MSNATEARELELCGKVEMRIALAEDSKLQALLTTYLPPLLLKLGSEHASVRNKVISTCQHIKIRLAGNQSIVLPVAKLLAQYKENPNVSMIRHFDLMFIQQSIGKLSSTEQMSLLPVLLHGLANDAGKPTCATIFNLFLRLLPQLRIPLRGSKEDNELRSEIGLDDHVQDAKFVALWFSKLILLTIVRSSPSGVTCPGLTASEYEFLTLNGKSETWDPTAEEGLSLIQTKIVVLAFLSSGAFTDEERFLPALFASGDTNSRISSAGEDMLKRSSVSLEDSELIATLLNTYFTLKPALQTRILVLLSKSAVSTTFPHQVIKIVQQAIRPDDSINVPAKGLETMKFRNALFNYMNWVSKVASATDIAQVAPSLVGFLRSYIEDQGWPVPHDKADNEAVALRALAYETIGSLAKTTPSIALEKDLSLVRWLFRSLTEEESSGTIFVSIEGSLSSLLNVFSTPLDPELIPQLRGLLLRYMNLSDEEVVRSARFSTARWANRCLEYSDIVARWIDILALGGRKDERSDVVEEGKKGLDPYWYQLLSSSTSAAMSDCPLPNWGEMVKVFFTGQSILENSVESNSMKSGMEVDSVSVFGNFAGEKINAFAPAVSYCRRMLLLGALKNSDISFEIDADWERQLDILFRSDKSSRSIMKAYIKTMPEDALQIYLSAALEGMLGKEGNGLGDCGKCLLDILSLAPSKVVGSQAERAVELLPCIKSNNAATREISAQVFGILAAHPTTMIESVEKVTRSLLVEIKSWSSAIGAELNKVSGAILAIGFLTSRIAFYGRSDSLNENMIQESVDTLLSVLADVRDGSTKEAVLNALGQMSASGILTTERIDKSSMTVDSLVGLLATESKKGNERAISALGRLSVVFEDESETLLSIFTTLYGLFELKQAEVHFTVGEALSTASACWQSEALILSLDVDADFKGRPGRSSAIESVITRLLRDCKTTKPSLKKASGIWLFSVISNNSRHDQVQSRLRECQSAFMGLLSARDDLVQETASRGLSLVYEQGDAVLRKQLVNDLMASFTGTTTQLKVDEETELFEPGALPTGDNKSVTSYKDIVSLADELGNPSLVYKFMALAQNAATWTTRAAFGRFGLSQMLTDESIVDAALIKKLYRYKFDPNPNVQRSMNDIWGALVKDTSKTIDLYFDDILAELLNSILAKEWRTRQASCAAIADLVSGREFEKYEKHLSEIWSKNFKVLDDIKLSVREAALSLSMSLTGILVRQVEQGASAKATSMLKEVLPFLLSEQGMESSAEEVRVFGTITVLKLIKSGGKALLPFVPDLVEKLIGLLSTLEGQGVEYVRLRAAHYNLTEEKIDNARSTAVSQSPIMEAIERCLDILDEASMQELVPRLENAIKTSLGMPSKIGCGGVLVSLATRHSFVFRPHADVFLKLLEKAVLDRNNAVSAGYARACGYLTRLASDNSVTRLATYSKKLYFDAEDETRRQISADIIYSVSKFATDRFNAYASAFLPFVFFAKHDSDDHVKEQYEKTWSENVGGSRAVLLYSKEIIDLAILNLDSAKWTIKHTAALSIAEVVSSSGSEISLVNATELWPGLEKALSLKTFDGKEVVLEAFLKFVKGAKSLWQGNPAVALQMKKIAIREAKRNNDNYRPHSFDILGKYAELRTDIDMFTDVENTVLAIVEEAISEDKMDIDEDTKSGKKDDLLIANGLSALFRAVNVRHKESLPASHLPALLGISTKIHKSSKITAATKVAFYERMKALFEGLSEQGARSSDSQYQLATEFFELLEIPSGSGTEVMRTKRGEAACSLARAVDEDIFGDVEEDRSLCKKAIRTYLIEGLRVERSPQVKATFEKAMKNLDG